MNKTALRNFATHARRKLRDDVILLASQIGVNKEGITEPEIDEPDFMSFNIGGVGNFTLKGKEVKYRKKLVERLSNAKNYEEDFEQLVEETAYTWFNRLIAIRFMEVNEYLPERVRVLSSASKDDHIPEILTNILDLDIFENLTDQEKEYVIDLKKSATKESDEELFSFLFFKVTEKLKNYLPYLFEKTDDYLELLFKPSFIEETGVIYKLVNEIDEDDFNINLQEEVYKDEEPKVTGTIEIIGWLYQYYNEEYKDKVINIYKGTVKKADIPAATQLFTTDWVVKYIVDNSLGRYWIERNPNSKLQDKLEFFVTSKDNKIHYIDEKVNIEGLTFFDPCVGSGHFLIYAFNVLMEIYKEEGYIEREAAQKIVEKNLYGLDIDKRAAQLAYFSIMIKGRSFDRRFFTREIKPNIMDIKETNLIDEFECAGVTNNSEMNKIGSYLLNILKDAKEYGSLIKVENLDYEKFEEYLKECEEVEENIYNFEWKRKTLPLFKNLTRQAKILSNKYKVVATNPPYLNKFEGKLKKFITTEYKQYKGDLFSAFIFRNFEFLEENGYSGFMTPFVWMFIKTYEELRNYIINHKSITTLIQMEYSAFEEATVPICSFVLKNGKESSKGLYFRLSEFKGGMDVQKKKVLEALENKDCGYFYETSEENFTKIPGMPIAYWASENFLNIYVKGIPLGNLASPRKGNSTSDNNRFLKLWYEIEFKKIKFKSTEIILEDTLIQPWYPYNKGGGYRKWYGNNEYVIDWYNDAEEIRKIKTAVIANYQYFCKPGLTWSTVSSKLFSLRKFGNGFIFDNGGCCIFDLGTTSNSVLGLLNSNVFIYIFGELNPTLNFQSGEVAKFPILVEKMNYIGNEVDIFINLSVTISKFDWDTFETSWDFKVNPLVDFNNYLNEYYKSLAESGTLVERQEYYIKNMEDAYLQYKEFTNQQFQKLKENEEELNRIFIEIYGLEDELTPEVSDRDITIAKIFDTNKDIDQEIKGNKYVLTKKDVVKQFISYGVGCMLGRYSLDVEGLAYAGGEFDKSKYKRFIPDRDNCIPITDSKYFEDDIVTRFEEFVKVVYGEDSLEENLGFIAEALTGKGDSREVIRSYFLKDFYKDHVKTYQKRPIYWLYDSGKQNGFKALIYMHRYDEYTTGKVRTNYLHKLQKYYEDRINLIEMDILSQNSASTKKKLEDEKIKIQKQLDECRKYDEVLGHIANERITIDLDDGVKVNYEKVQKDRDGKVLKILSKI